MSPISNQPDSQRSGLITALMAGLMIALLAAVVYLFVQVDKVQTDMAAMKESVMTELSSQKQLSSATKAAQEKHLETLKAELLDEQTKVAAQAKTMSAEAQKQANAHTDALTRQIADEEARMKAQVAAQQSEIGEAKQSASAANAKIADVSTDVGGVKTQVSATQAELQKTISELKSVRGDLGVQSGLVATNGTELAALKLRGERNYIDVKLDKKTDKKPKRFADITLLLKSTDAKKNRYTVQVMADDKLTEKKDKSINEPVQFYTSKGGHIPYELVINSVTKEGIVGYLATPKEVAAR